MARKKVEHKFTIGYVTIAGPTVDGSIGTFDLSTLNDSTSALFVIHTFWLGYRINGAAQYPAVKEDVVYVHSSGGVYTSPVVLREHIANPAGSVSFSFALSGSTLTYRCTNPHASLSAEVIVYSTIRINDLT